MTSHKAIPSEGPGSGVVTAQQRGPRVEMTIQRDSDNANCHSNGSLGGAEHLRRAEPNIGSPRIAAISTWENGWTGSKIRSACIAATRS